MRRQGIGRSKQGASEKQRDAPRRPTRLARHSVVRARRVSDNNVSKGAAPSIVGEEKVHAPVRSIRAGAGQEVALLAADTEAGLCCNGGHGVANSVVRGGSAAAVRTTEEMDPEQASGTRR